MTLLFDSVEGCWTFELADGTRRALRDPDGPPAAKQLLRLASVGWLAIRDEPGALTKLECAQALDAARGLEGEGGGVASKESSPPDPLAVRFPSLEQQKKVHGGHAHKNLTGAVSDGLVRRGHTPPPGQGAPRD